MERIDATYAYDAPTHSVAIAPVSILTVVFSEVDDPQPSTTTTIGFFTRDPIGFFDGENLYTARMLLARLDPSGMICFDEKQPCSDADGKGGLDPNTEKVYHLCMAICKSTLPIKNPLDVCKNCKKLPPLARPMCDYLCKEAKKHTPLNYIPDTKDFFCDKVCCSGKLPDGVPGDECIPEFYKERIETGLPPIPPSREPRTRKVARTREEGERACLKCCDENYPFHSVHKNMCQKACTLTWPIIVVD